jgi:hypothetical protein
MSLKNIKPAEINSLHVNVNIIIMTAIKTKK